MIKGKYISKRECKIAMTTLTSSQNQPGTTTNTTGVESYEDMFKEITRKLYGDESAHGLYPINNSQVAQLAQTPSAPPEGERSFTTLVSDRNLAQLEYEGVIQTDGSSNFKSEDHLSTAFGLAALMHNGFPPPAAVFPVSNVSSSSKPTTQSNANSDDRQWTQQQGSQQNHSSQQEEALWNSGKTTNAYTQKLFKIKTKQEPVANEIIINTSSTTTTATSSTTNVKTEVQQVQKRYSCSVCPYSTDRRDLFTRHENIHKEEKPFHCYACLKQFNRADHVKKHFLRMHREMDYDINKTRRYPPSSKQIVNSSNSNNSKNSTGSNNFTFYNQQQPTSEAQPTPAPAPLPPPATINIPSFTQQHQQTVNASQQQQPQQQTQQGHHHSIEHVIQQNVNNQQSAINHAANTVISIKNEKTGQKNPQKAKGEKRFMCCYCPWSGADNWGLKRHLNTHTKPFVCLLCDYKAARSERLTTHILKVHNKKACNKCSFFADDQAQLTQHQIDSHQNETPRPARVNNTNNQSTSQALATNQSISQPVLSVNNTSNIAGTGGNNVLRSLTNTFVPNTQSTSSSNNNVFGTLHSSLNNGVSTIYTTSNTNNIVEQINHHLTNNNWRTNNNLNTSNQNVVRNQTSSNLTFSNTSGAHTAKRKSGAERLFAYFEADDSEDLELDYARQLQMQALSRNTSCVAQDFHNAGGEKISKSIIQQQIKGVNSVSCDINNGTIGQQQLLQQTKRVNSNSNKNNNHNNKAMSPIDHSPPATLELISNSVKRRRKSSSSNDKENVNELLTKQLSFLKQQHQLFLQNLNASLLSNEERLKAINDINDIFEGMYRNSLTIISSIEGEKFAKLLSAKTGSINSTINNNSITTSLKLDQANEINDENNSCEKVIDDYKLPAFLRNNKEITVIMDTTMKYRMKTTKYEEGRKNRKQLKPKKIEKDDDEEEVDQRPESAAKHQWRKSESQANHSLADESRIPNINNLRDKHMLKLVTKKKCCYECRNKSIDTQKNTKESLLLHSLWHHAPKKLECHRCETKFNKLYKLKLHKTLRKH